MKTNSFPRWLALAFILSLLGAAGGSAAESTGGADLLEPVRFQQIKINGFWLEQIKLQTEKWLPHCVRQMEQGGEGEELLNLIDTGQVLRGGPAGKFRGRPWADAYIYNTVEAICLALAVDPQGDQALTQAQALLRGKVEEWIPLILAAQEKDGYIHSFHVLNAKPRYSNIGDHEFYVAGYFLEMGIAHFRMTGGQDRRLFAAALRCADHLDATFGPAPKRTWKNGHPGLEHALCRLGALVNEVEGQGRGDRYISLARHFLDHQHKLSPRVYDQSDKPVTELAEAQGHAVRGTYFYSAMAGIAGLQGDAAYRSAVDRLWASAIHRKHYLTGGVGASEKGEAFGADFELPNTGYCEACAGCGLSFWAEQMHRLHSAAHYCDVQERVLYNNVLGAVERSGRNFFYQNPLVSAKSRYSWHNCPCCVGNIPRTLIAIKDLMYSVNRGRDTLYVDHYVDSEGTIAGVGGATLRIRQQTKYPWEGDVTLTLQPGAEARFTLALRIPDRTESDLYTVEPDRAAAFSLKVNGQPHSAPVQKGYAVLTRTWRAADRVELLLPMAVQRVRCDERVAANRGRVAIQRGPVVYSFEDVDHAQPVLHAVLKPDVALRPVWRADLLGGVMAIEGGGFTAVPNYARLNRGGASQVWMIEDPAKAK